MLQAAGDKLREAKEATKEKAHEVCLLALKKTLSDLPPCHFDQRVGVEEHCSKCSSLLLHQTPCRKVQDGQAHGALGVQAKEKLQHKEAEAEHKGGLFSHNANKEVRSLRLS